MKNSVGKQVPALLPHYVEVTQLVGFTLMQKLRLLLGYKVLLVAFLHSQHSPGKFSPTFRVSITPHPNPSRAYDDKDSQILVACGQPWPAADITKIDAVEDWLESASIASLEAIIATKKKATHG